MFTLMLVLGLGAQPDDLGMDFFPEVLVRGKATQVTEKEGRQRSRFIIEHVYAGAPELKGKTFELENWTFAPITSDESYFINPPIIKPGEVGIWWLTRDPHEDGLIVDMYCTAWKAGGFPLPARKDIGPPYQRSYYEEGLKWAQAVEEIYRAKGEERGRLLKQCCLSENISIASWGIQVLGTSKSAVAIAYLDQLVSNEKLSLAGQMAVDVVLSRLRGKDWLSSDKRLAMLEKWVSAPRADAEAEAVLYHLQFSARAGGTDYGAIDYRTFLKLLKLGLANDKMAHSFGAKVSGAVVYALQGGADNEDLAFDFLLELLQGARTNNERDAAAAYLGTKIVLTKDRRARLMAVKEKVRNPEVAQAIDQVLRGLGPEGKRPSFEALMTAVGKGKDLPERQRAAADLGRYLPFDKDQTAAVKAAKDKAKDPIVAELLERLLESSERMRGEPNKPER